MAVQARTLPLGAVPLSGEARQARSGPWLLGVLLVMVSFSGVSGLVYQVLWVRSLSLTFGVTTAAVTAVLAGFMAGLAIGSYLAGRAADRVRQPLLLYGVIEIGIALFGFFSPSAFASLPQVYRWLPAGSAVDGDPLGAGVRIVLAFLIILLPTTLMGATLPVWPAPRPRRVIHRDRVRRRRAAAGRAARAGARARPRPG